MNISGMYFWARLEEWGEASALITNNFSLSYSELATQADEFANKLRANLPENLTRPLILLETANEIEPIVAYIGALRAGWPVILVAQGAGSTDSHTAETYKPNIAFLRSSTGWHTTFMASDPIPIHPDLAVLLSTSGTTGATKLVRLSAQNLQANATSIASYLGVERTDRAITALPFHYSYGMSVLHIHLLSGAGLVLTESSLVDTIFWDLARKHDVASLALVPTQFEILETCGFEETWLPKLRYISQAGGRLDPMAAQRFTNRAMTCGWQLFIMYGQTEAGPRISYLPPQDAQLWFSTIGQAIPGGKLYLMDAAGHEISGAGSAGELVYEGPNVMQGYALSRSDLVNPAGPSLLRTGDIAERLENGYFRIIGRTSRFIKLFGLRIGLDEIEIMARNEGYKVYASGNDTRLAIFLQGEGNPETLQNTISICTNLPKSVIFVEPLDTVPLLPSGKIDYRTLARRAEMLETASPAPSDIVTLLKSALRLHTIDLDKSFMDLGGDSLSYLEVQLYLSERHGEIPTGWERMPLHKLIGLEDSPRQGQSNISHWQSVSPDLLSRTIALLAVIALHSTNWPTGGGSYLLLILAGYSLARFQGPTLFDGKAFRTLRIMLLPILSCYYSIITLIYLVGMPIDLKWFFLLGNFSNDVQVKGLIPYWFVSAYAQIILMATLPFLIKPIRSRVARAPFLAGIIALIGVLLATHLTGLNTIPPSLRHHNPLAALELLLLGWCILFATSAWQKLLMTASILFVWLLTWRDVPATSATLVLLGSGATLWNLQIRLPKWLAHTIMRIGSLALFIYLTHVPVISAVFKIIPGPDILRFVCVTFFSIVAAYCVKAAYEKISSVIGALMAKA